MQLQHKTNLRADGAWVLYQILEHGHSSRECLALVQARHSHQDSNWLQEMTMGSLRKLPQLQIWLRSLLNKPLKGNKKILEHLLMLGIYQLAYSRVSPHAAVAETVNAAALLGGQNLKGLINAVMRNFQRQELDQQQSDDPIIQSGLPKWLYKALANAYPDDIADIIVNTNSIAPVWLRVNPQQTSMEEYCAALTAQDIKFSVSPNHSHGIILEQRTDITSLPGYKEGWFSVQDGAAQLAAGYLSTQANERILDCCAAPGGKTAAIMETNPQLEECVALDSDPKRLRRMQENMDRLQLQPKVICADASDTEAWWDGQLFDRILLDAPCSATGVIRRHPDIRWLRKASDIEQLTQIQALLLRKLWHTLKPGGTLLYATCSVLPAENKMQIEHFLKQTPDAQHAPLNEDDTLTSPGRQILPNEQQMDGFYYARLIKSK
jgi:16S rRNA (cytosine967-C5)-methyltransferase